MKTKVLLLGAVVTAFAFSASANDVLLSPRAAGNQIKVVSDFGVAPAAHPGIALLMPRAQDNQIASVSGSKPVLAKCAVLGSPRAVSAAGSAARTACCGQTIASCPTTLGCGKTN
jgi:hypothetical protein